MSRNSDVFEEIDTPHEVLDWLSVNWGFPREPLVRNYGFYRRAGRLDTWIGPRWGADCLTGGVLPRSVHTVGTLITREPPPGGYPASGFLRSFGHLATRRVLELEGEAARTFLAGEAQELAELVDWSKGYAVVMIEGLCAGRGLVREGVLLCEMPKNLRLR